MTTPPPTEFSHRPPSSKSREGRVKNRILIAAGLLGAFSVGLFMGRVLLSPPGGDGAAPISEVTTGSQNQTAQAPLVDGKQIYDFQEPRAADAPRALTAGGEPEGFAYRRLILETSDLSPQACLQFSADLDASGNVNYADYIRLSPETKPSVSVNGTSLCLGGLGFDKDYRAEIRAGLPALDGTVLENGSTVTIAFGDKPAFVGFAGEGVILPRLEADGLGIETVNVEKVKMTVRRISDRSLFRNAIDKGEATGEDEYPYLYGDVDGRDGGVVIWEGELETKGDRNSVQTTVFPLGAALKGLQAGVYFLQIEDAGPGKTNGRRKAQSWRWVMYTDMALTSYRGSDGMDVFVRSIETARPITAVEMVLLAQNNDILAKASSNADGRVRFDGAVMRGKGALAPKMVLAYGSQDDFAALDLTRAPLDLSERNVAGRSAPPLVDGFLYLDRGIYRPGETVHLTALLRDDEGRAIVDRAMTLKTFRPNGTLANEQRINETEIGGFNVEYEVPKSAARGLWRFTLEADGVEGVGEKSFSVEDFVPQRLAVALKADEKKPIRQDERREMTIESRFLYGAPASDLAVEGEVRYRVDPNPFPTFKGYRYGPAKNSVSARFKKLPNTQTDADGRANLFLNGRDAPEANGTPLRADIVVGVVEPGGRVVRESARIPVRHDARYVGVRSEDNKSSFSKKEDSVLEAIILDREGKTIAGELEWRLVREDYWYDWYRDGSQWRWRRSYRDVLIAEGRTQYDGLEPAKIRKKLDYGSYRLAVWEAGSSNKTEQSFYVGWRTYGAGTDTPDQAVLSSEQEKIVPGTRARLFLAPPYAGEATIVVASDKVHLVKRMKVEEGGREVIIDTDPAWGNGFYVMATVVTPRDAVKQPIPRRAMGVHYVAYDMAERTFDVSLETPEVLRPRQKLALPVTIAGAAKGEAVRLTVAAVDEGILRLTKFDSPNPVKYFYGKKRLGLSIHDDYGRILNANLGVATRFGGDQIGGEGLSVVPTKSVALFSGPVAVGVDGKTVVEIDVPDFNGELRLMAVAWSADKMGHASKPLTVRDPVPAEISLSRFLAPGDKANATLLINNVDGVAGEYTVSVSGSGPIEMNEEIVIELAKGEKQIKEIPLTAGSVGIGFVALGVSGPNEFQVSRAYPIEVRTPWFPVSETATLVQKPGEKIVLNEALLAGYIPGSGEVNISYSRLQGVEPGPLLDSLYRYPYGCTEQLTSSSFPLLFVDRLGGEVGRGPEYAVRPRVQAAINKLLDRQGPDGAIGLWRVGDRYGNAWLGPYVTDFFQRARAQGYGVSDHAMDLSYNALEQIADTKRWTNVGYILRVNAPGNQDNTERYRLRAAAYANFVLAKAGRADLSDLRYFHDSLMSKVKNPLAKAHIGAALAIFGDKARADNAFREALKASDHTNDWNYYQTPLRDAAGIVTLISEAGYNHLIEEATENMTRRMKEPRRMHTQEKAHILMATHELLKNAGPVEVALDGRALEGLNASPSFTYTTEDLKAERQYENRSQGPLFVSITKTGAPKVTPPASSNGVILSKRIVTREGRAVSLSNVKQNDRFIIVLSGRTNDKRNHPLIIADLLPAGFEIETILRPGSKDFPWLAKLSYPRVAEARDDRFVAAVDIRDGKRFTLAYEVRAITPGRFTMPGAVAEDMYRPGIFARTTAQNLSVASIN